MTTRAQRGAKPLKIEAMTSFLHNLTYTTQSGSAEKGTAGAVVLRRRTVLLAADG